MKYPLHACLVGIWINSAPTETSVETLEVGLDSILGDAEFCEALYGQKRKTTPALMRRLFW